LVAALLFGVSKRNPQLKEEVRKGVDALLGAMLTQRGGQTEVTEKYARDKVNFLLDGVYDPDWEKRETKPSLRGPLRWLEAG
jgi:hypothetical protein